MSTEETPTSAGPALAMWGWDEIGRLFGVAGGTVEEWKRRYRDTHPIPQPDYTRGGTSVWFSFREAEWRAWEAARPGQGAGGGPKPRSEKEAPE